MVNYINSLIPVYQALLGGLFSFFVTSLGAGVVFLFKNINKNVMNVMVSIAAGIMLAASYFSLLAPAIESSISLNQNTLLVISFGFLAGGILLYLISKIVTISLKESSNTSKIKKCLLLMTSITLHNIPEGLVIGVAFGAVAIHANNMNLISALTLTLGIAIQNFPEGSAISLPLRREGYSRLKAFIYGSLSGIVEPIFAVVGALLVIKVNYLLPFVLSFAAGAMIFVTVIELIPESQTNSKKEIMGLMTMTGFSIMMILEILLG